MQWVELSATADSYSVDKLAAVMGLFGRGGCAIEEWPPENRQGKNFVVKIFLPYQRSYKQTRAELESKLSSLSDLVPVQLRERRFKPQEWIEYLNKYFGLMELGERFIIKPSWIKRTSLDSKKILIELDPGEAFGTGLHPTTRLCLLALEKYLKQGMIVLDLGTGTGILAIAAAKLGAAQVLALDIDPIAIKAARDNIRKNGVDGCVQVRRGTLSVPFCGKSRHAFDLVLANITAKTISDYSQSLSLVLKAGGILAASGIHAEGLDEALIKLALAGFSIRAIDQEREWYGVVAVTGGFTLLYRQGRKTR